MREKYSLSNCRYRTITRIRILFLVVSMFAILSSTISPTAHAHDDHDTLFATIQVGETQKLILIGELALTPQERQTGLMHRPLLDIGSGMLFVFERPQQLSFWMRDTLIPLSIAFVSRDGEILNIEDMEPLSLDSVPSEGEAQYALEVNRGYFATHDIVAGDRIILTDCPPRSALLQHAPQKVVGAVLRLCHQNSH